MNKSLPEAPFNSHLIPFSTHINQNTTISKSGLISQTIRINPNSSTHFQQHIQEALTKILNGNVFINIHAIHEPSPKKNHTNLLSHIKFLQEKLSFQSNFSHSFYITISIPGYTITKNNIAHFLLQNRFLMEIQQSSNNLQKITENFCKEIQQYKPHILTSHTKKGIIFSQNNSFLYKLLFMSEAEIPFADIETSNQIKPTKIKIEKSHLIFKRLSKKEYISCLTIKDFPKADPRKLVELFTVNHPFTISQSLHLVETPETVHNLYKYQNQKAKTLRGNTILQKTKWEELSTTQTPIAMQTNITIHGKTLEELNDNIQTIATTLSKIGLTCFKEDINLEQAFASFLPANPHFLNRLEYTTPSLICQFILSKNMLFHGISKIQNIPFLPITSTDSKHHAISTFETKASKHILIHGNRSPSHTIFTNCILLNASLVHKTICLEDNHSSTPVNVLFQGTSTKPKFNMLNLFKANKKDFLTFFTSLLEFFIKQNQIPKNSNIHAFVHELFTKLTPQTTTESIYQIFQESQLQEFLNFAKENGFLENQDCLSNENRFISINTTNLNSVQYSITCLYVMLFSKHYLKNGGTLKLDRSFATFQKTIISENLLPQILTSLTTSNISLIALCNIPKSFEENSTIKYFESFSKIPIQVFFESSISNSFTRTFFQIHSQTAQHFTFFKHGSGKTIIKNEDTTLTTKIASSIPLEDLCFLNVQDETFIQILKFQKNSHSPQELLDYYQKLIED